MRKIANCAMTMWTCLHCGGHTVGRAKEVKQKWTSTFGSNLSI